VEKSEVDLSSFLAVAAAAKEKGGENRN